MTPPETHTGPAPPGPAAVVPTLRLHAEDILAAGRRLWVRGRVVRPAANGAANGFPLRFWGKGDHDPHSEATLETCVGGHVCTATLTLDADGRFDTLLETNLAPTHRAWRVAVNSVTCSGQSAQAASVILNPPRKARQPLV